MAKPDEVRTIRVKKYANRRLYDTDSSRYVNLRQISDMVKEGNTVEVVDSSTGEDLTKVILTQIILEEEKGQRNLLPTEFLHQLIQSGETAYEEFLQKFLSAGVAAYTSAQEQMEGLFRNWMKPWSGLPGIPGPPDPGKELEELRAKIKDLEKQLAARNGPSSG